MRNAEWHDLRVGDLERHTRQHLYDVRSIQFVLVPLQGRNGAPGHEHLNRKIFDQRLQPDGMIVVFMCDKNGIDAIGIFANRLEPLCDFLPAHTGVNQDTNAIRFHESRVAAAPASEHRHGDSHVCTMSCALDRTGESSGALDLQQFR